MSRRAREELDRLVADGLLNAYRTYSGGKMPTLFVSRLHWGARDPIKPPQRLSAVAQRGVAVHHSGEKAEKREKHAECPGVVREIQRFHQDTRGWNDVAYNWLCCQHGYLFEGRGLGVRSAAQGTADGNAGFHAVCWLGDGATFQRTPGSTLPLLTARAFVRSAYPRAWLVWPHLRFHPTECPGRALREWCRQFPDSDPGPNG